MHTPATCRLALIGFQPVFLRLGRLDMVATYKPEYKQIHPAPKAWSRCSRNA
jgi:hypothetical protein